MLGKDDGLFPFIDIFFQKKSFWATKGDFMGKKRRILYMRNSSKISENNNLEPGT